MTIRALCVFLMCLVVYVAALPADGETLVGAETANAGWGGVWSGRAGWGDGNWGGWGGYGDGSWGGRVGWGGGYWGGRAGWGGIW